MRNWDYIVIGGGSAGCAVAARLSEDPSVSVALIEAGGDGKALFLQVPNAVYFVKGNARYHWLTKIQPDPTRDGRAETLSCGRGLGGGSAINGLVFVKGLASDYTAWASAAGPDWAAEAVDRSFRAVETMLRIEPPSPVHPVAARFLQSAFAYGMPKNSSDLLQTGIGAMPCPTSAAGGWRQSTARTYLRACRGRPNLTIMTRTTAFRLALRGDCATGVIVSRGGREHELRAEREVIVCAGAINTPPLLMRSGIGPADHLKAMGIQPLLDLPGVGAGLHDHPCVWISAQVRERTWNDLLTPGGIMRTGMEWLLRRSGPAASGMCHVTLYGATGLGGAVPDHQMSFIPAGYIVRDDGVAFLPMSSVTTAVSLCRPAGRGSVRLASADPRAAPIVNYRLLDGADDVTTLRQACRAARDIHATAPFADIVVAEAMPGSGVQSDAEWAAYLRRNAVNMCHPVGSCRMGIDDDAVVGPRLRVRGIAGLRIADASIMPQITSGNTNAPAIMIGEQAAAFIRADRSGQA